MVTLLVILLGGLTLFGLTLLMRSIQAKEWAQSLVAFRLGAPSGLKPEAVSAWLGSLSALTHASGWWLLPHPPLVVEIVASRHGIAHYVLMPRNLRSAVLASVRAHLPGARLEAASDYLKQRPKCRMAAEWRLTSRQRSLAVDRAPATAVGVLASLQPLQGDEQVIAQWILTGPGTPQPVHKPDADREASVPWWLESDSPSDADDLRSMRVKQREQLLNAVGRLGVVADSKARAYELYGPTWGMLRMLNAPGVQFVRRHLPERMVSDRLAKLTLPVTAWPVVLNAREAVGVVALPLGDAPLPGVCLGVARQVPPPNGLSRHGSVLAISNYPGSTKHIRISREDRLRHLYVVGPTGVGKSTLMANIAIQDMQAGDGLALIDPKGDLVTDVLARVPAERQNDVIVIDLADTARPIGLNLLHAGKSEHNRELAADHVLAVLKSLWSQYWGPRTDDVLRSVLLTLTHSTAPDGSAFTLVEVPELLTNAPFRRMVVDQPTVPTSVRAFWAWFESLSEAEAVQVIGPSLNKLRSFTTRTSLRLTLGQSSGLDIAAAVRNRKILLVNLNRGLIGSEAAFLCGSLLVSGIWQAALSRASLAPEKRRPFWLHLDEFQQIARLPIALSDMLAEARAYGLGVVMANQYVAQLPPDIRAAALGTVRNLVSFQIEIDDARTLEPRFAPSLTARDLSGLAAYEVGLRLMHDNQLLTPCTGTTVPLPATTGNSDELREASRQRNGRDRMHVEQALRARIGTDLDNGQPTGRRRRGGRT